jgi:hypothetical protein
VSQRDSIYGVYPERFNLASGVTLYIPPLPGQISMTLKYISGGSLSVIGSSFGYGITLPVIASQVYTINDNELLNFNTSGGILLIATGSTAIFDVLRGRSAGFGP